MIVKQVLDNIASEFRTYEVYEEAEAQTPTGETVTVLNKVRTTTIKELNDRIANIQGQIDQLTTLKDKEQSILNSINEE